MAEAVTKQAGDSIDWTPTAAVAAGEVILLPDGRAAYAPTAIAAGVKGAVQVCGIVTLLKTAAMVMLKGSKVYWDHSASTASLLFGANTRDFFVGVVQDTAAASDTTVNVALNVEPKYTLALEDGFSSLPISTAGFTKLVGHDNGASFIFDATAEAQKLDALSLRGIAANTPGILSALVSINVNGDDAAFDLNVGLANATHATDADSITESLFAHVDGGNLSLNFGSDDTSSAQAVVDSTLDAVLLTPVLIQWDLTDWSDIKAYVNGVRVLDGTTGADTTLDISAAVGPMKLLAHMEKTSNDSPGNVTVMDLGFTAFDV